MLNDHSEYQYVIINQTGDRVWGTDDDGNGPHRWVTDSQCASMFLLDEIPLPPGGIWVHWKDPRADF